MNPYRSSSRPAAIPAASAKTVHARHDLACMVMFAVGGLVGIAGMLFADGTELAVGGLTIVAGLGRAQRLQPEPLDEPLPSFHRTGNALR